MNTMSRVRTAEFRKLVCIIPTPHHGKPKFSRRVLFATAIVSSLLALFACSPAGEPAQPNPPIPPPDRNLRVTVTGISFHDYNGNGTKEYNEPVLPGVDLEFYDKEVNQRFKIRTDTYGVYSCVLPASTYQVIVGTNSIAYNNQPLRYLYASQKEVRRIDELTRITVTKDTLYELALMQGFLTLPFSIVTGSYIDTVYFDVDRRENFIRDWQGNQETYDQHTGIDYRIPMGTPVIAAAPGQVLSSTYDSKSGEVIAIVHGLFITQYGHLSKRNVRAGEKVSRGQQIGLAGSTGEWVGKFPHLHFDLSEMILPRTDVYRDITNPASLSYWTVDNKPQYP